MSVIKKAAPRSSGTSLKVAVFYKNAAGEDYSYEFNTVYVDNLAYETLALRLGLPSFTNFKDAPFTVLTHLAHLHIKHYPDTAPVELIGLNYDDFTARVDGIEPVADDEESEGDTVPPSTGGELSPVTG